MIMNKEEQIKEIEQFIYDYVDSKQTEKVYLFSSRVNELAKPFVHNKGIAEALYNAGYRKVPDGAVILTPEERDEELKACNEKQAELEAKIEILKIQNNNLEIAFDRLNARSERFESNMKSVLEIEKRNAVEEFAKKVKEYINNKVIADFDDSESVQYYTIDLDEFECEIDEILKELTE